MAQENRSGQMDTYIQEKLDHSLSRGLDVILGRHPFGESTFRDLLKLREEVPQSDQFAPYRRELGALIDCLPTADVRHLIRIVRTEVNSKDRVALANDARVLVFAYEKLGAFNNEEVTFLQSAISQAEKTGIQYKPLN